MSALYTQMCINVRHHQLSTIFIIRSKSEFTSTSPTWCVRSVQIDIHNINILGAHHRRKISDMETNARTNERTDERMYDALLLPLYWLRSFARVSPSMCLWIHFFEHRLFSTHNWMLCSVVLQSFFTLSIRVSQRMLSVCVVGWIRHICLGRVCWLFFYLKFLFVFCSCVQHHQSVSHPGVDETCFGVACLKLYVSAQRVVTLRFNHTKCVDVCVRSRKKQINVHNMTYIYHSVSCHNIWY